MQVVIDIHENDFPLISEAMGIAKAPSLDDFIQLAVWQAAKRITEEKEKTSRHVTSCDVMCDEELSWSNC